MLNSGPSSATDVVVTLNLDPSTTFNAGLSDPAANHAAGMVTITVGTLANDGLQGTINVEASVVGAETDEDLANNTDTKDTQENPIGIEWVGL